MDDLSVVIPCKDEDNAIIQSIVNELEKHKIEVIVVDDGSKKPFKKSIKHGDSYGYGAALLTGIKNASRPLIITMDGDGQHSVADVFNLYIAWKMMKDCDLLIGSRRLKYEKWLRMWGRKCLNWIASLITGYYFQDLNSGMRMFNRDIAIGYAPILCKRFSFTTSITISMLCDGYRVESFPIRVEPRKFGKSHVKVVSDGFVTLYYILYIGLALRTRKLRKWLRDFKSLAWIGKIGMTHSTLKVSDKT